MASDVPLGVLLSGGIDSNAVVALMSTYPGKIKTFTIGFEDKLYDERNEARFLAERLGTDHHEMVVRPDVTDLLPKLVRAYDEPFADPSAIPSYYVAQMARQSVTVVLNGDGGDESFAGYGGYIQGRLGKQAKKIPQKLGGLLSRVLERKEPCKANSLSQVLALCGRPPAEIFSHLKLMLPRMQLDALLSPDYKALVGWFDPINHLVNCYGNFDRRDTINTMLAVDRQTYLPDDLLFKIDIASMSHGLEARSPFLDHHLVEFAAGLPGSYKLRGLKKKYILKKALKDILPEQVLKRSKRGFDVPVSGWLRGELEEHCREAFTSRGLVADLFKTNELAEMFEEHVAGRAEWGRFFWMILMLHLWSETFLKGETGA
jgi:asparagine synthase (glutamine-hydrolysing)